MDKLKVAFIGLGLIGGSIAMTIRKKFPEAEIIALNRSDATLKSALDDGIINAGIHEIDDNFKNCDYIFLSAPVDTNISFLEKLKPYLTDETILTDAGSVKGKIHAAVEKILPDSQFIGGHPMAGSEKSGYANANDHLIENAYYILTPSANTTKENVEEYKCFIKELDAIPLVLSAEEHDYITAAVSHLPHIVAYSLVQTVMEKDSPEEYMKMIAAGGFKDITRIASSDATMWEQICLENPENIRVLIKEFMSRMEHFDDLIKNSDGDEIHSLFDSIKNYRNSIREDRKGALQKIYDMHCDIIDETGAIATIATLLSTQGISIKNIGIVHNRTYEQGVLHIEYYDEISKAKAAQALSRHGYTIFPN